MRIRYCRIGLLLAAAAMAAACDGPLVTLTLEPSTTASGSRAALGDGPYPLPPPAWDIDATPDGGLLVAVGSTIFEIRRNGIAEVATVPTLPGAPVNGLKAIGRGSIFAASGGLDLARGAGVWHVTRGRARLVGDIHAFETATDPDAFEGPRWKDQRCEEDPAQGFTAGPQSNPYHLTAGSSGTALVADAAGNTLLSAKLNGEVDWVALFTPPLDGNGDYRVLFALPDGTDCYVQPVPTSVDIGPDGAVYVGELTGVPAVPGWSRIWRIAPGAVNVVCPSAECEVVATGLTSVIDIAFGPDGRVYVAEYDANGWLAAVVPAIPLGGGSIRACDVVTGVCELIAGDLVLPAAIAFDKWGGLWVLEDNLAAPTVRRVPL